MARWLRLLPTRLGDLLLCVTEARDQLAVAGGLLDRVQVLALHVLDDGELGDILVGELAHDDGHGVQRRFLRRAPAPLAGDDLIAAALAIWTGDNRLHETLGADRLRELGELGGIEILARIEAARMQLRDGQQALLAVGGQGRIRSRRLADERSEAAAEAAFLQR